MRRLLEEKQVEEIVGLDVSIRSLERASERLRRTRLPETQARRVRLIHGSPDIATGVPKVSTRPALVEVIEHLDPPRLLLLERTVFEFARPTTVVLTMPNREYNVTWLT